MREVVLRVLRERNALLGTVQLPELPKQQAQDERVEPAVESGPERTGEHKEALTGRSSQSRAANWPKRGAPARNLRA